MTGRRSGVTIAGAMLDQRDAASVLATWRDVERRLSDARLSTDEAVSLADESARLRVEYRRVTDLVLEQYRSQQDRWPETAASS